MRLNYADNVTTTPWTDREYELHTLKAVEKHTVGYDITTTCGWTLSIPDAGVEPHVGDIATFFGRGIGYPVRGVMINDCVVYYRTKQEERAKEKQREMDREVEQRADFEKNRASADAQYDALPAEFRSRLDRFRAGNQNFRWQFEPYELMVCVDAVKMAEACRRPETGETLRALGIVLDKREPWPDTPEGRLKAFVAMKSQANSYRYKDMDSVIPGLDQGHSGNSFGMATRLAYWALTRPEIVVQEHGAMVLLTGCKDYGCTHAATA